MPPRPKTSRRPRRTTPPRKAAARAGATVVVEIANRQKTVAIDRRWLRDVVRRSITALGFGQAEIGLAIVDDAGIADLHALWMGLPDPTDVITFDLGSSDGTGLHGDIAVSAETARRVARTLGWQPRYELAYYVVHGLLHLAGEDDLAPAARRKMRTRERDVMAAIGLPSPPRCRRPRPAPRGGR
ncbi:MAG: rRNA maturation RNase YbeY [Planctomycetes bacterium]|nr:rRNA maturation RNase YbeY [Planctomycetota bacterium]